MYYLRFSGEHVLRPEAGAFQGTATFSVRYQDRPELTANEKLLVPSDVVQSSLQALSRAHKGPVVTVDPNTGPTDAIGHFAIIVGTEKSTIDFTQTQRWFYVHADVLVGLNDTDTPRTAFSLLAPYMKQDVKESLITAAQK